MLTAFASCGNDEPGAGLLPDPVPEPEKAHRTVLVYMVSNNNLSRYAMADMQEMVYGVKAGALDTGGRLLVYSSLPNETPRLYELKPDGSEALIKSYTDNASSVTVERMRAVIADAKEAAPADDYGLVLWSHATGWLNDSGVIDDGSSRSAGESPALISPLSFGADGLPAKKMSITSLARALEGHHFSFIYFDCCHMATVEVAYELRHAADRIVASPTELGVEGMPYNRNLECFFLPKADIDAAAANTFDYYTTNPSYGCAITTLDTGALDRLAASTRSILSDFPYPADYSRIPYFRKVIMTTGIFDLADYIEARCTNPQRLAEWRRDFYAVVTSFRTTDEVYFLDASRFHGLGTQIIESPDDASAYDYTATSWWADVVAPSFTSNPE